MPAYFDRRAFLRACAASSTGAFLGGCIIPARSPPRIEHGTHPIGAIVRQSMAPKGVVSVGGASVDITPPEGSRVWLAGFGFSRAMRTVRDPIAAQCFYIDDGHRRFALVVLDVVGLPYPSVLRIRQLVGNGIDVAVASTHNHQGPDTIGYWGASLLRAVPVESGIDVDYLRVLERRAALSVKRASDAARPARLFFARAALPKGIVRNLRTPGQWDDAIDVLEARDLADGRPLARFVDFGCHPETLGDRAQVLTSDFPGVVRVEMERVRKGTTIFANGSLGGMITPDVDDSADLPARVAFFESMGKRIADLANDAIANASPIAASRVAYFRREVELHTSSALARYVARVGLIEPRRRGPTGGVVTEVGRVDIGPISWALIPGEPTPRVGLRIKEALARTRAHATIVSLANDEIGYILDAEEFDDPEFSYEATVSLGRDVAATVERALAELPEY